MITILSFPLQCVTFALKASSQNALLASYEAQLRKEGGRCPLHLPLPPGPHTHPAPPSPLLTRPATCAKEPAQFRSVARTTRYFLASSGGRFLALLCRSLAYILPFSRSFLHLPNVYLPFSPFFDSRSLANEGTLTECHWLSEPVVEVSFSLLPLPFLPSPTYHTPFVYDRRRLPFPASNRRRTHTHKFSSQRSHLYCHAPKKPLCNANIALKS